MGFDRNHEAAHVLAKRDGKALKSELDRTLIRPDKTASAEQDAAEVARHDGRHLTHVTVQECGEHGTSRRALWLSVVARAHLSRVAGSACVVGPAVVSGARVLLSDAVDEGLRLLGTRNPRHRHNEAGAAHGLFSPVKGAGRKVGDFVGVDHESGSKISTGAGRVVGTAPSA